MVSPGPLWASCLCCRALLRPLHDAHKGLGDRATWERAGVWDSHVGFLFQLTPRPDGAKLPFMHGPATKSDERQRAVAESQGGVRYLFPQTRAIEIRLPSSFEPDEAGRLVWLIQRAGFNAVLLNCFSRGYTFHASPTMSASDFPAQHPDFHKRFDPLVPFLKAARETPLTVYALVEGLRVGGGGFGRGPILHERPEWGVRGRRLFNGSGNPPSLCPVNRDVWRFLGDLFYEIVETYGFRALYLRHMSYPLDPAAGRSGKSADYCRCDFCRRSIYTSLGVKIDRIPDDPDHPDRFNLTAWRSRQLSELVRYLRLRLEKAAIKSLTIGEIFLEENEVAPDVLGYQNASDWAQEHLVPIAALRPLPSAETIGEAWTERLTALARSATVMPVLPVGRNGNFAATVERFSTEPVLGIVVPEPHDLTAPPLTQLAAGPWREPTAVAEQQPLVSVAGLLAHTIPLLDPGHPLRAFLSDVLRVLEPLGNLWLPAQRESLYENLLGLEERIVAGKISLGEAAPPVLRNFRLARQLLKLVDMEP